MRELSVLAVIHRLAELIEYERAATRRLVTQVIESCSGGLRLAGPPAVGEEVAILGDDEELTAHDERRPADPSSSHPAFATLAVLVATGA